MGTVFSRATPGSEKRGTTWSGKSLGYLNNCAKNRLWVLKVDITINSFLTTNSQPGLRADVFFNEPKFRERTIWLRLPVWEGTTVLQFLVLLSSFSYNLISLLQWLQASATIRSDTLMSHHNWMSTMVQIVLSGLTVFGNTAIPALLVSFDAILPTKVCNRL